MRGAKPSTTSEVATYTATAAKAHVRVQSCAATNQGHVRRKNEDRYLLKPPLFAVADGMGGLPGGDVAAELATESLRVAMPVSRTNLVPVIEEANSLIRARALLDARLAGMGTTLTAALLWVEQSLITVTIGHVGDSRAYEIRDRKMIVQLSKDHSLAEMGGARGRSLGAPTPGSDRSRFVLTRAVGLEEKVRVDTTTIHISHPTTLVLCTDGVWNVLEDFELVEHVHTAPNVKEAAERIVTEAGERGDDNATAIVVSVIPRFDDR